MRRKPRKKPLGKRKNPPKKAGGKNQNFFSGAKN